MSNRIGSFFPSLSTHKRRQGKPDGRVKGPSVTFEASAKQCELMEAILSGETDVIGFGGGIRATKTFGSIAALITLHRMFPGARSAIVRQDLPTLRRNLLPSMEKLRTFSGGFVGPVNQGTWTYPTANSGAIILFAEQATRDPDLERWKGLEVNWILLEEASELQEASGFKAIERAGSYIIPGDGEQPPPLILVTFNPCKEWPRKWFYEPWKMGTIKAPYKFIPSTIADNPFAPEAYKKSLEKLPKKEYDRFVKGEWDFVDDPDQLIKAEWLWAAREVKHIPGMMRLGVDVARYGDDASSWATLDGNGCVALQQVDRFDLVRVSAVTLNLASEGQIDGTNVHIDAVGLGAGVVDICRDKKLPVREFLGGATPVPRKESTFTFKNLRSQAWWEFRERLREGTFSFAPLCADGEVIPTDLMDDLLMIRYEISGDKVISVESKDTLKKRLGRSPDDGDALVMAAFDFPAKRRGFVA